MGAGALTENLRAADPDRERWLALVSKALKGASFEEALVSHTSDGIRIEPLSQRARDSRPCLRANPEQPWIVCQRVDDPDVERARAQIAEDLAQGATGLALVFEGAPNAFGYGLPFAIAAKIFGQVYFARRLPRLPLLSGGLAVLVAACAGFGLAAGGDAARMAAFAATLAFAVQAVLLGAMLVRDGIWRPSPGNLRPIAASLAASAVMLGALPLLLGALAGPLAPGQPLLHRAAALALLCLGGAVVYGAVGALLGAFGALPLRKRRA